MNKMDLTLLIIIIIIIILFLGYIIFSSCNFSEREFRFHKINDLPIDEYRLDFQAYYVENYRTNIHNTIKIDSLTCNLIGQLNKQNEKLLVFYYYRMPNSLMSEGRIETEGLVHN